MPKEHVVSFRLEEKKFDALTKMLDTDEPYHCNSENQLARKIVDDVLSGRLVYASNALRKGEVNALGPLKKKKS